MRRSWRTAPCAGIGQRELTGYIDAVDLKVSRGTRSDRRGNQIKPVIVRRCDIDCVLEPLAVARPANAQTVWASTTADIHSFGAIIPAIIRARSVVVRNAFTAVVKVLNLNYARHINRRPTIRCLQSDGRNGID